MLSKIIGAGIGGKLAQQTKGIGGTTGAAIGAAVPFIVSRMSIPAMIAMGVGGYAVKKYLDKKNASEPEEGVKEPTNTKTAPVASIPQPATS